MSRVLHEVFYRDDVEPPELLLEKAKKSPWYVGYNLYHTVYYDKIVAYIIISFAYKKHITSYLIEYTYDTEEKSLKLVIGQLDPSTNYIIDRSNIDRSNNFGSSSEETIGLYREILLWSSERPNIKTLV